MTNRKDIKNEWVVVKVKNYAIPKYSVVFGPYANKNYAEELLEELPTDEGDHFWSVIPTEELETSSRLP